ncbi:MAG: DUF1559 domain-containing protein [Planctomycetaceae bacterium]|nr:DUF1559 domain-containing protein [Planctomycetaceae bacterium]
MRCPSSPLPEFRTVQGTSQVVISYVPIAGSNIHGSTDTLGPAGGHHSAGGLFPGNSRFGFRDITDGSSNVMIISEQAGYLTGQNKSQNRTAVPDSGAWMGNKNPRLPNGDGTWSASGSHAGNPEVNDMRCYNTTTIRQQPNPPLGPNWQVHPNCNTPLTSTHTGGVQVLLGDGTVRFISENIDLTLFKHLADKDDGNVIGEF